MNNQQKVKNKQMYYSGAIIGLLGLFVILMGDGWIDLVSMKLGISLDEHSYLKVLIRAIPITMLIYGVSLIHKAKTAKIAEAPENES